MILRRAVSGFFLNTDYRYDALTYNFPEVRKINAASTIYLSRCARCFLKGLCEQCPAKSWMEHGSLDTPVEYLCKIAHAQAEYLGMLKKGERAWKIRGWKKRIESIVN